MERFAVSTQFHLTFLPLCFSLLLTIGTKAHAATLYVSQSGDGSYGLSWETAHNTIAAAVVTATTSDNIHISAETYQENLTLATPITLLGGFDPSSDSMVVGASKTIVDGNHAGSVIQILDASASLENLTITNGMAANGGGVYVEDATLTLRRVEIVFCRAANLGGGVYQFSSDVTFQDCDVSENGASHLGSGVYADHGSLKMLSCRVKQNSGSFGIKTLDTITSVNHCEIAQNAGMGLWIDDATCTINRSRISENLGGGIGFGYTGYGAIDNCLIANNRSDDRGAGITFLLSNVKEITNSTIYGNISGDRGGGAFLDSAHPIFKNCIFWANTPYDLDFGRHATVTVYSSLLWGGNIHLDPRFVDPASGNFHLLPDSPCIDSGTPTEFATDLDGAARPYDVIGVGTDGPGAFDMGAYEFIPAPTPAPTFVNERSDIDGSHRVDAVDLLILLGDWMKATGASR